MRESATILKVLHHFCRMSPGWEKPWNFQHKSTFVNLILEKIAKGAWFRIKKLSYFRLEIYKKYGALHTAKIKTVENSVESVEFHPKSRRGHWIFEHFPRTFQHVEKIEGIYKVYMDSNVENFCRRKNYRENAHTLPGQNSGAEKTGNSIAKNRILWYTSR